MTTKRIHAIALALAGASMLLGPAAARADQEGWLRDPAVSPDGRTILFTGHGDIWRVPSGGGEAVPLTRNGAWDGMPVWSRDGQRIAFASDRFGNLDVFVMNADGTGLVRLTFHEADDLPSDFSPDGERVLFSSARIDDVASGYFPTRALPELYEVPVAGGAPRMVFTNPAREARWSPDGLRIAYRKEKAFENEWRQRDVSSFARDIWIYDTTTGDHRQVTTTPGGDHSPVWAADGNALYMQSELDGGSFNVRRVDLASGASRNLTGHGPHAARGLSRGGDGLLAYSYHGVLHTVRDGEAPRALQVHLPGDLLNGAPRPVALDGRITEFAVSPDGAEVAFVARGEVFVADAEFGEVVRITNTPEQERSVAFAPDGRALVYAAQRDRGWALYETKLTDANAPRFSAATGFEEKLVYAAASGLAFQPQYSPDGKQIGFIEDRDAIRVVDRDGSNPRTIFPAAANYSYSDGDIRFAWSPDSKWLAADYSARGYYFYTDIGIAPADGSAPPRDISVSGYQDSGPIWHPGGEVVFWFSDRYGERTHGSWGSEGDVVAAFLTEGAWTRFNLNEQERALLKKHGKDNGKGKEKEKDGDKDANGKEGDGPAIDVEALLNLAAPRGKDEPIAIEFNAVEDRTKRLTVHSSDLADAVLTKDLSALYYLSAFEGGYDLWRQDFAKDETARVASLGAKNVSIEIADDRLFVLADGKLLTAKTGDKIELKPVKGSPEMVLRADAERAHLFRHVWAQVADKFYDPAFHGVNWAAMRTAYEPKVAAVSNNRDFAILMSEMLGQLNASHTGMRYRRNGNREDDDTAALGAIFDLDGGPGLRIAEILPDSPLDRDALDIRPGDRIVGINGTRLAAGVNPFESLNRHAGDRIRLTIAREGGATPEPERVVVVRAYSLEQQDAALYERWVEQRRAIVEERSGGRIGYVHIRSMSDDGFRQTFDELFGRNFDKQAVVVDTRFNGGGWLHDELITLLDGKPYFNLRPRGRIVPGAPEERWSKPSAVVMNEGNYSNAHMFPYAYKLFGVGKLVGMPVPGTATAVWWETLMTGDLVFGIPQLPVLDQDNRPLENQELQPDLRVDNPPADAARGADRQLEAAVDALLAELGPR